MAASAAAAANPDALRRFLRELPKVELHAHLSGSVREQTVLRMLREEADAASLRQEAAAQAASAEAERAAEELRRINTEIRDFKLGERSLSDCFHVFKILHRVLNSTARLREVTHEVLCDFALHDGCVYLELRTTPRAIPGAGVSKEAYVRALLEQASQSLAQINACPQCQGGKAHQDTATCAGGSSIVAGREIESSGSGGGLPGDLVSSGAPEAAVEAKGGLLPSGEQQQKPDAAGWAGKEPRPHPHGAPRFFHCNLLLSADRTLGADDARDTIRLAHRLAQEQLSKREALLQPSGAMADGDRLAYTCADHVPRIVGVDFSGNPTVSGFHDFVEVFREARELGLPCSVHAGEVPDADEDMAAILDFPADRLGHAVLMSEDRRRQLIQLATAGNVPPDQPHEQKDEHEPEGDVPGAQKQAAGPPPSSAGFLRGVEICLTSNLKTGSVSQIEQHPFREYLAAGVPMCLCTDDSGVFNTSLTREWEMAAQAFNLDPPRLLALARDSVRSMVFDRDARLHRFLERELARFEAAQTRLLGAKAEQEGECHD